MLSGDLRDLSFRTFDKKQKREAYERQKGICVHCGKHFKLEEMEADHITPWKEGGTTVADNGQMLCRNCNRISMGRNKTALYPDIFTAPQELYSVLIRGFHIRKGSNEACRSIDVDLARLRIGNYCIRQDTLWTALPTLWFGYGR